MRDGAADSLVLLRDGVVRGVGDERVSAKGDDGDLVHFMIPLSSLADSADRASLKHDIGAVVMPAPIWPTPALRCAMPVLMIGSTPESATSLASMPAGVPPKLSGGSVNAGFAPSVMLSMRRLFAVASAGVPPTNCTIAGDAAIAKPPSPFVSVIAESPRSAAASSTE